MRSSIPPELIAAENASSTQLEEIGITRDGFFIRTQGEAPELEQDLSRDRQVRQARFYVLKNTAMPAVLLEVGFVTGAEDAALLADPNYREQMAEAIARGVLEYVQANL